MIRDQVKCEKAPWSCVGGSGNQEELIHTQTKNVGSARDRAKAERRKFTMEKHRREREERNKWFNFTKELIFLSSFMKEISNLLFCALLFVTFYKS